MLPGELMDAIERNTVESLRKNLRISRFWHVLARFWPARSFGDFRQLFGDSILIPKMTRNVKKRQVLSGFSSFRAHFGTPGC